MEKAIKHLFNAVKEADGNNSGYFYAVGLIASPSFFFWMQMLVQIPGHGKTYEYMILTCTWLSIGRKTGQTSWKPAAVNSNNFGDLQW